MSTRWLLVVGVLWLAKAAAAQTTGALPIVEDRGNNAFSILPGPVSLEVVITSDCSVPATVTTQFKAAFSTGTDRVVRTARPKATVIANYQTFNLGARVTESYSADLSVAANGGVTIVQEKPGVCRQVTITCGIAPPTVSWLISSGDASSLASGGGRLQHAAHVTESKSSTLIDCPPPPTARPAGPPPAAPKPTAEAGTGLDYPTVPIPGATGVTVDEDDVFEPATPAPSKPTPPVAPPADQPPDQPPTTADGSMLPRDAREAAQMEKWYAERERQDAADRRGRWDRNAPAPDVVIPTFPRGVEYPAIPIPGGTTTPPAPADETIDLGDLLIGAEYETVPDIPRGSFRSMSCLEDLDCIPIDDGGYFLGRVPGSRGRLGDAAFQHIGAETLRIQIPPVARVGGGREPMNPLGLLSKSVKAFVEWWMPTLEAAEQNLQQGLQLLIGSQGGSTGRNLTMQVLNFTGRPVKLEGMIALEPLKKEAQQRSMQAFARLAGAQLPAKIDLSGYCLDFLKLPPLAGQVLRFAGPEAQKRFGPMKKVLTAANSLMEKGLLKPDTNPASYADSIKQWALWTVDQKFDDKKFGEAFLGHTKKNVEAAGQKWTRQIEDVVRQRTPNRWQDIVQILKGAGVAVPR